MRWEDEQYVRFYKRNTPEWSAMHWTSRGLMGLIMREVDRAGILECGKIGLKAVAVAVRAPWDEIEKPLAELLADGCILFREDLRVLVIPNFVPAQEANASDKARQRSARERARDRARVTSHGVTTGAQPVTVSRDDASHGVTEAHANPVNGHSVLSVLSSADQILAPPPLLPDRKGGGRTHVKADETSPEAERAEASTLDEPKAAKDNVFDLAQTIYGEAFKKRHGRDFVLSSFGHQGSDEWAFVRIGRLARERLPEDPERWLRHVIGAYLKDDERWLVDNAHPPRTLERRLNKYGEPKKPKPPKPAAPPELEKPKEPEAAPFKPLPKVSPKEIKRAAPTEDLPEKARLDKERLAKAFGKEPE
jgi:hypothetical protein